MREIRTSGSMSGERKRSESRMALSHRASSRLYPYKLRPRRDHAILRKQRHKTVRDELVPFGRPVIAVAAIVIGAVE